MDSGTNLSHNVGLLLTVEVLMCVGSLVSSRRVQNTKSGNRCWYGRLLGL